MRQSVVPPIRFGAISPGFYAKTHFPAILPRLRHPYFRISIIKIFAQVNELVNFVVSMKHSKLTPIEVYIEEDFGPAGSAERNEFELACDAFILGEQLRAERLKAGLDRKLTLAVS